MRIKVLRAFYGDEKGVKAGDVIHVTDARGRQLIQRKLAEQVAEPDPETSGHGIDDVGAAGGNATVNADLGSVPAADKDDDQTANTAQKAAEVPDDKQADQPVNKAAATNNKKSK